MVFGISDDILVVEYDRNGTDHDKILRRVVNIFRKENLKKLSIYKCHFKSTNIPLLWR